MAEEAPVTHSSDPQHPSAGDAGATDVSTEATPAAEAEALTAVQAAPHESKTGMPQLDPTWVASQLFWLSITFVLLYVVMARSVVPRIRDTLENRQSRLDHDIDQARQLQEEAETARINYEKSIEEARTRATGLINDIQAELSEAATERHKDLDAKLAMQMTKADARIAESVENARARLRPVVTELCNDIVRTVILQDADSDAAEDAIDKVQAA